MNNSRKVNFFHPAIAYPALWVFLLLISSYSLSDVTVEVILIFWFFYILTAVVFFAFNKVKFWSTIFVDPELIKVKPSNTIRKRRLFFEIIILAYIALLLVLIKVVYASANPEFLRFTIAQTLGGYVGLSLMIISLLYFYQLSLEFISAKTKKIKWISVMKMLVIVYPFGILGSRALLGIYVFTFLMVFYFHANLKNWRLIIFGMVGGLAAIGIRLMSILTSTDQGRVDYFELNSIISKDNWFASLLGLLDYTVSDILYRTDVIIKSVPYKYDFLGGEGIFFGFITLLPGRQISPYIQLNHNLFKGSNEDIEYPPTLIAQFYLDFGYWGVIIGAILISLFYNYVYLKFYRTNGFIALFFYIVFSFYFLLSVYGALQLVYIVLVPLISVVLLKVLYKEDRFTHLTI